MCACLTVSWLNIFQLFLWLLKIYALHDPWVHDYIAIHFIKRRFMCTYNGILIIARIIINWMDLFILLDVESLWTLNWAWLLAFEMLDRFWIAFIHTVSRKIEMNVLDLCRWAVQFPPSLSLSLFKDKVAIKFYLICHKSRRNSVVPKSNQHFRFKALEGLTQANRLNMKVIEIVRILFLYGYFPTIYHRNYSKSVHSS